MATPEKKETGPASSVEDAFLRIRRLFTLPHSYDVHPNDPREPVTNEDHFGAYAEFEGAGGTYRIVASCWTGTELWLRIVEPKEERMLISFNFSRHEGLENIEVHYTGLSIDGVNGNVSVRQKFSVGKSSFADEVVEYKKWEEFGKLAIPLAAGMEKMFERRFIDFGFIQPVLR